MKKLVSFIYLPLLCVLCACGTSNEADVPTSKMSNSDIKEFFLTECPALAYVNYYDYTNAEARTQIMDRNWEDNTYEFGKTKKQYKVRHIVDTKEGRSTLDVAVQRDVLDVVEDGNDNIVNTNHYDITLEDDVQIQLLSPAIDDCSRIPLCYYDGMVLRWNGLNNGGKVLIELSTNGMLIQTGAGFGPSAYHYFFADDDGYVVIPNSMFVDMEHRSLVDVTITRANVFRVELNGQAQNWNDIEWDDVLSDHEVETLLGQTYLFASASVAQFSMVLVKEL